MLPKEELGAAIAALESRIAAIDTWILILSAIVALGIAGELYCGVAHWLADRALSPLRAEQATLQEVELKKLNTVADDARTRAADAELALAKFRAWRTLTQEQRHQLAEAMRKFSGITFDCAVTEDKEALGLVEIIEDTLKEAGWQELPWGNSQTIARGGEKSVIGAGVIEAGVSIQSEFLQKEALNSATHALAATLVGLGIDARAEISNASMPSPNHAAVHIIVGRKM